MGDVTRVLIEYTGPGLSTMGGVVHSIHRP